MKPIELTFNFIGMSVVTWQPVFRFFHEKWGMKAERRAEFGDWANLGGGWDVYYESGRQGAIFELFDGGRAVTERRWGVNQGIRPGFHVPNLSDAIAILQARGVAHGTAITEHPWGRTAEIIAPEDIRIAIAEVPGRPASDDLAVPHIGHVAIKCADVAAMRRFYGNTIGYEQVNAGPDYTIFAQQNAHPLVILEPGGGASSFDPRDSPWELDPVRAFPVFLSMMTPDIHAAHIYLQSQDVTILRDIITHEDWGGTDLHIADPDGNAIQIVQYG
jgi:catechol 2,3-dioxygenase-like lactoylglutathione lyase family enzyme